MINTMVLPCVFNGHNIPYVLNYTHKGTIPLDIVANFTDIGVGYIVAGLASFDVIPQFQNGLTEKFHLLRILPGQMKGKPQCGLSADAGQPGQFIDRIFK